MSSKRVHFQEGWTSLWTNIGTECPPGLSLTVRFDYTKFIVFIKLSLCQLWKVFEANRTLTRHSMWWFHVIMAVAWVTFPHKTIDKLSDFLFQVKTCWISVGCVYLSICSKFYHDYIHDIQYSLIIISFFRKQYCSSVEVFCFPHRGCYMLSFATNAPSAASRLRGSNGNMPLYNYLQILTRRGSEKLIFHPLIVYQLSTMCRQYRAIFRSKNYVFIHLLSHICLRSGKVHDVAHNRSAELLHVYISYGFV